jgi:hypothetical protein
MRLERIFLLNGLERIDGVQISVLKPSRESVGHMHHACAVRPKGGKDRRIRSLHVAPFYLVVSSST